MHVLHKLLFDDPMANVPSRFKNNVSAPGAFADFPNCCVILAEVESSSTSLALTSKVKSLVSRPEVLENWPVLGSRTAVFFELLKFCGALEKFFGKRFFVEIA